jgi:hypothetical protein
MIPLFDHFKLFLPVVHNMRAVRTRFLHFKRDHHNPTSLSGNNDAWVALRSHAFLLHIHLHIHATASFSTQHLSLTFSLSLSHLSCNIVVD